MNDFTVPYSAFLKQAILQAFTVDGGYSLGKTPNYTRLMKDGFNQFWGAYNDGIKRKQNIYADVGFHHATPEVFGWRRPIVEHEGEPRWKDEPEGRAPFESAILVWDRQCYPHNHLCHRAGYGVLPSYPTSMKDVEYRSDFHGKTLMLPPGSVIHKFWKPVTSTSAHSEVLEGNVCRPVRTGEVVQFELIGESYVRPGEDVSIGPEPYHTLEPLPEYTALSLNVYMPPLRRYKGQHVGGTSCQSCSEETYNACTSMREVFEQNSVLSSTAQVAPAYGADYQGFLNVPSTEIPVALYM